MPVIFGYTVGGKLRAVWIKYTIPGWVAPKAANDEQSKQGEE